MASNSSHLSLSDYGALIRRRRVYVLSIIPSAILLSVFVAYILPATYQSSATILLEPSTIDPDVKKAPTYVEQQIELVQRQTMSKEHLADLVNKLDPYPQDKLSDPLEKAQMIIDGPTIERVDPVTMLPLEDSNAFSIHYNNPDPVLAATVAQHLADLFLHYNQATRTQRANEAAQFLRAQAKQLDASIRELEQRRADFKRAHANALPDEQNRTQDSLDRTRRDLDIIEGDIRVAEQKQSLLSVQLSQVPPTMVGAVQDSFTQLATLKAQLAEAQQKYTASHPDIKRLERAIADLNAQIGTSAGPQAVKPDNPEYLRIASELGSAQQELTALRTNAASARARIQDYETRIERSPTVERDYLQLERDYQVAQEQFQDVQKKLQEAEYNNAVESEQHGDRFTLIHAPHVSDKIFSPNRLGIILLGVVLGTALAGVLAAFADSSDPTVRSARDLLELPGLARIGAVPVLFNKADQRRIARKWAMVAIAYTVATVLVAATVIQAARPRAQVSQSGIIAGADRAAAGTK
jgi:polysaccharide chain length determinant protein (PEP-CTERM system associated)